MGRKESNQTNLCAGPYVGPQQMYSLRDMVILVLEEVCISKGVIVIFCCASNVFVVLLIFPSLFNCFAGGGSRPYIIKMCFSQSNIQERNN